MTMYIIRLIITNIINIELNVESNPTIDDVRTNI